MMIPGTKPKLIAKADRYISFKSEKEEIEYLTQLLCVACSMIDHGSISFTASLRNWWDFNKPLFQERGKERAEQFRKEYRKSLSEVVKKLPNSRLKLSKKDIKEMAKNIKLKGNKK